MFTARGANSLPTTAISIRGRTGGNARAPRRGPAAMARLLLIPALAALLAAAGAAAADPPAAARPAAAFGEGAPEGADSVALEVRASVRRLLQAPEYRAPAWYGRYDLYCGKW